MQRSVSLPPGPRPRVPGALEVAFWRDPSGRLAEMARRYGDASCFRFGPYLEFLLVHPDLIRAVLLDNRSFAKGNALQQAKRVLGEGLLTSEGELHLRQRRLIQPIFHSRRVAGYAGTMVERTERMLERWEPGTTVDVHGEMTRLTLGVVGDTLFGADVEGEAEEIGAALTESLEAVNRLVYPFVGPALERLPLPSRRRFRRSIARLDATIERLIDERRASPGGGDLLSMLLEAQEEGGNGMPDRQVRDEAMTLFLAGHETTANLLTWTWYLLSQNPEAEARLHAEIDAVVGPGRPGFEHVAELELTRRVIDETLRLYPPAWVVGRRAVEEVDLGGVTVPAGAIAVLSPFVTQRDERWFPDPLRFDPDRWLPEASAGRPQYAFFPFGGGQRVCIGESFARVEAALVLATVARAWSLRVEPGHPVSLLPRVTLRPRHGMRMVLARRG